MNKHLIIILVILSLGLMLFPYSANAQTQLEDLTNTFNDNSTGFTIHYPSDWQVASNQQLETIFGPAIEELQDNNTDMTIEEIGKPLLILYPKQPTGANIMVMYQQLPSPMTSHSFMNSSLMSLPVDIIKPSNISSTSIGGLAAFKVDLTDIVSNTVLTQLYVTKNSTNGFIIQYPANDELELQEIQSINSIVGSIRFN
ncbi:hypothetical protein [Candidatus Nitrosocosmicus sp. SS]|jgi:hypothetical protein|uniref:hypothetical protein n=1 Tax=Candidatus Nitrosocosmicus agrestis TaxID=2563600 RepID=UPI00122E3BB4|nr:hypothetical protein [Candidatus Nitrosocosmicus sp. SS]KAA2282976.1 hypothetical protein F1Z66_04755 [Candidatus Nitrosocosmicus sp. SS]KAF0869179.1 hypothetical protein E5N71_07035 [Candidatus Nitrosocosmicus sp. SS]